MSPIRLVQIELDDGPCRAARVTGDGRALEVLDGPDVYGLALAAGRAGASLAEYIGEFGILHELDYDQAMLGGQVVAPIRHPDPAHCLLSGTGLTHRVSAQSRDAMHAAAEQGTETDSMRMYRIGERGGRPSPGAVGAMPEWFFKGDGSMLVPPGGDLPLPAHAGDGGDEAELAGVYVIGADGCPLRLGFALANEYSDHVLERQNYLYLAHSKLRCAAIGPEILVGDLPPEVRGRTRILRGDQVVWSSEWTSGERHMCHTVTNLEHHHFKYPQFRRPGDVHIHFLGAAAVSCSDGVQTRHGDRFELSADPFVKPLVNRLAAVDDEGFVGVRPL